MKGSQIPKLTSEACDKLGMEPGDWFRNLCLWECYKARPQAFDQCRDFQEVVSKGLLPDELIVVDCIDLDF